MNKRDDAVNLLQHYFALAMGKRSKRELDGDYLMEIADIVDLIIEAAVQQMKGEEDN